MVGPDGTVYVSSNLVELWAVCPDGSADWAVTGEGSFSYHGPAVSPNGDLIVTAGSQPQQYGFIKAFSSAGEPLWEVQMANELGYLVAGSCRPIFEPGDSTAYVPTEPGANPQGRLHCSLFSVNPAVQSATIFADGFESGDLSAWSAVIHRP